MKAIDDLLQLLNTLRKRADCDSLGRVVLSERELHDLRAGVCLGFELGLSRLSKSERKRWGAAALLLGAKALRTAHEGPFSYERITAYLSQWPKDLNQIQYNAIEDGAKVWGIEIMRVLTSRGPQRGFLGTMIRHSGAGWVLLEKLAALVARQGRWNWVVNTEIEAIAAWIRMHARRTLGEQVERTLDEETGEALAARLQDLAAVRATLGENTSPAAALQTFGTPEMAAALDAPNEDATRRMLGHLCPAPDDETWDVPRWRWHLDGRGYERVVIEIPPRISAPDELPADVDQISLKLFDDHEPRAALYSRACCRDGRRDTFEHREGPRRRVPRSLHAQLVAQYRGKQGTDEVVAAELTVPTAPVAVFDTERGRLHPHPRPGTRVALVLAPGWQLHDSEHLRVGGQQPLRAWIGTSPPHDLVCQLSGPDGETLSWTLSATPPPLQLTLTNAVAGLRLAQAPVVFGAPELRSNIMRGKGTCTRRSNGKPLETLQVVVRGGRVKLSSAQQSAIEWPTGVILLDFALNGHTCTERIAVLPATTRAKIVSGPNGTTATLGGPDLRVKLRVLVATLPAQEGDGSLTLSPDVRGRIVINYSLPDTSSPGVWRIFAHPQMTEVVDVEGAVRNSEDDLSALRSGGGLRVYGEPRATVQLQIEDECWSLRLSPDGERVFPFNEIPSPLLQREAEQKQVERVRMHIRWPDGHAQQRSFVILHNKKPLVRIVPGDDGAPPRVRVAWERRMPGELRIEAVRAWQPWAPSISLAAQAATWPDWDDKVGYEAEFPFEPGSYQLALCSGPRRLSGVTLVFCPDGSLPPPPSHFSPLEAHLWFSPNIWKLAPLVRQWSEAGEDDASILTLLRNMTRFGIKWFRIAEVLPEITGSWRLEALLREEPEELDRFIADYYEQTGISWLFVRERDLDRVAGRPYVRADGTANTLLNRVAELDAGLLRAGARAWGHLLSTAGPHQKLAIELHNRINTYERPRRINHDERTLITEQNSELNPTKICIPRLLGLQQLRRNVDEIEARHRSIYDRANPAPPMDDAWFERHPERLQQLERAVATSAWRVHRWRRDETMTFETMRVLSRVEPLARKSFDYWLNSWDLLDTRNSGDKR